MLNTYLDGLQTQVYQAQQSLSTSGEKNQIANSGLVIEGEMTGTDAQLCTLL